MEQRRVLLAIGLAFLVLYVWQALFVKPVPKAPTAVPAPATSPSTPPAATPVKPAVQNPPAAPQTPSASPSTAATALVADAAERDVRVETRDVIAVFTNRGARLKSWRLKSYRDGNGEPQELVEHAISGQPLPFTLRTNDTAVDSTLNDALFAVTGETAESNRPIDLRFEYRDSAGVHALKQFHLDERSF